MGMVIDKRDGKVARVDAQGQGGKAGVRLGWQIVAVDRAPFNLDSLTGNDVFETQVSWAVQRPILVRFRVPSVEEDFQKEKAILNSIPMLIDARARRANTASRILKAVIVGDTKLVMMLLDGATNKQEILLLKARGRTPLHEATRRGHIGTARVILEAASDRQKLLQCRDNRGHKPLMCLWWWQQYLLLSKRSWITSKLLGEDKL